MIKVVQLFLHSITLALISCVMNYQTFFSDPIKLLPGQVINTNLSTPIDFVTTKNIGIRYLWAEVVDDDYYPVPLNEVYVRRWAFYPDVDNGVLSETPCSQNRVGNGAVFSSGAETRGTLFQIPAPYALTFTGSESWTANINLIRSQAAADVQNCIECHCQSGTPTNPLGTTDCNCTNQAFCTSATASQDSSLAKIYHLKYVVGFVDTDNVTVVPVKSITLDATSTLSSDCKYEHQVPASSQNTVLESYITVPKNIQIVAALGHQHLGGSFIVLSHKDPSSSSQPQEICKSVPTYGGSNRIGDESGYLVGMSQCLFSTPVTIPAGHQLHIRSVYNNRTIAGGYAYHEGVMSTFNIIAVVSDCTKVTCSWAQYSGKIAESVSSVKTTIETKKFSSVSQAQAYCLGISDCRSIMVSSAYPSDFIFLRNADTVANTGANSEWTSYYKQNCSCVVQKSTDINKAGLYAGIVVLVLVFTCCVLLGIIRLCTRNRVIMASNVLPKQELDEEKQPEGERQQKPLFQK